MDELKRALAPAEKPLAGGAESSRGTRHSRLVTLVGAGGSGKTRLAIHAATEMIDSFRDGVWWVDLAPLYEPALVPLHAARALGVREQEAEPVSETLSRFIGDKQLMLVLDNCEHLIAACAQLVTGLWLTALVFRYWQPAARPSS